MTLSHAAQDGMKSSTRVLLAVAHVFMEHHGDPPTRLVCAAALRTAVEQVLPDKGCPGAGCGTGPFEDWAGRDDARHAFLAIATELENAS